MGLRNHLVFALLGSVAHALPGTAVEEAGPGRGGRSGAGPGRAGRPSDPAPARNWKQFLNLDQVHPLCPPDFPEVLFYDNFATYSPGSQPSRSKWQYDIGHSYPGGPENWGTGEIQYYTDDPANIVITDERQLRITPVRGETYLNWTSARIETTRDWDFAAEPGKKFRIQAVIKLGDEDPNNQLGIWPAFWSLGSGYRDNYESWPSVGEIDILESPNGLELAWQVLHCGPAYNAAVPCDEPNGIAAKPSIFSRGVWHVVSVDIDRTNPSGRWQDEKIVWRIDGYIVFEVSGERVGSETYWTNISNGDHMILLNVAVGGSFPNKLVGFNPDDPSSPPPTPRENTVGGINSSMRVKYVIVYGN